MSAAARLRRRAIALLATTACVLPPPAFAMGAAPGTAAYTRAQVKDLFAPPDWYPDDHPPMPEIVAHGRKPSVYACACCHLPDGSGQRENASEAEIGEAAAYFLCRCPSRVAWRSSKQNACRSRCAIRGTGPSRTSRPTASHAGGRS